VWQRADRGHDSPVVLDDPKLTAACVKVFSRISQVLINTIDNKGQAVFPENAVDELLDGRCVGGNCRTHDGFAI